MPRAPNAKEQEAFLLYKKGMKLIDIAKQLNVPHGTVRRWKCTCKWENKDNNECSKNNERSRGNEHLSKKNRKKVKVIEHEVEQVINNQKLTDKQQLFCLYYIRCFNATMAYQKAYETSYAAANAEGYKLLAKPYVKEEIQRLKRERLNKQFLSEEDIFQKYIDIAFSDISMYVDFGNKEIEIEQNGEMQKAEVNYINIKNSTEVDGTLITELTQSKDGVKIKLADKIKALQWLAEHMNLATEEQKLKINLLKQQAGTDENKELQICFEKAGNKNETG